MRDRVFIDTNILIYFISDDLKKKIKAKEILFSECEPVLSSQVINEFVNACLIKNLLKLDRVISLSAKFMDALEFALIKEATIKKALQIQKAHNYSYWDCLIIASALENNCSTLYTEDMQDGHVIENRLKIVNPFV
jgi:predicted nucleic acid-binding protein